MAKKKTAKKTDKKLSAKPKKAVPAKVSKKPAKIAKAPVKNTLVKTKVATTVSQVALQIEASKKKSVAKIVPAKIDKEIATTDEKLDPGILSKQQVKSLEKLIQKNAEWEQISGVLQMNARPYKMQDSYQEKMAIKHPVLGLGYVTLAENYKMTVLFKDGSRNLIMNYKS